MDADEQGPGKVAEAAQHGRRERIESFWVLAHLDTKVLIVRP